MAGAGGGFVEQRGGSLGGRGQVGAPADGDADQERAQRSGHPLDAYRPTFVKSLVMTPVRLEDPVAAIGAYWATAHPPSPEVVQKANSG